MHDDPDLMTVPIRRYWRWRFDLSYFYNNRIAILAILVNVVLNVHFEIVPRRPNCRPRLQTSDTTRTYNSYPPISVLSFDLDIIAVLLLTAIW